MTTMRAVFGLALAGVVAAAAGVSADGPAGKIDGRKLVGKWEPVDLPKGAKAVVEFGKDGKLLVRNEYAGRPYELAGTYKLSGNKLAVTLKRDGKDRSETMTVTKLTDDELVWLEAGRKKPDTLRRVKDAKK
jgi:uncharacterized protein (TIGR03066 family)